MSHVREHNPVMSEKIIKAKMSQKKGLISQS